MARSDLDRVVRLMVPVALAVGVGASALVFVRIRGVVPAPAPAWASAPAATDVAAMEAAHSAAGIQVGATGDVTAVFGQRVREAEAHLESSPGDRSLVVALARLLHDGHRTTEAVARYRQAIDMDPADAQPYYDLASLYAGVSGWDDAGGVLMDLLDRRPDDAIALYDVAAVRANQGRTQEARDYLARARARTSDADLQARISQMSARLGGG